MSTTIPKSVLDLIERFKAQESAFLSSKYKEAQLRQEFIDPLFSALGWDMENKQGSSEAYKDVVHEDSIMIGGAYKAPDYSFRVGGSRKYFLEAKKPNVDILGDASSAFQLRRYGWSAKLDVSILTNFRQFSIYDCRTRPKNSDKAPICRLQAFTCDDLPSIWEQLSNVFSKDAILSGGYDAYLEKKKSQRGAMTVDDAFLEEIEGWRTQLAKNIAAKNPLLSSRDLNFSVQAIIDRIVFLRICEDRGIEHYGQLREISKTERVYSALTKVFERADDVYNSGLFHFKKEGARNSPPDLLTSSLLVDSHVIGKILGSLYYPESPYEFSVLPSDILGQVYERFLGKVIRLSSSHKAVIEEKPEVKKAGGVYYTPTYISQEIVAQVLTPLVQNKKPSNVTEIHVLDPACGSGSFLIEAYEFFLKWHLEYYVSNNPASYKKAVFQASSKDWRLTVEERKRILLNNIYGVDIDPQAVEVTKLSLLLKVLEGANRDTIERQLKLFNQRALPDLEQNIKCGNSLVGSDYIDVKSGDLFGANDIDSVNPFDWEKEFALIFKRGGFDAIIGNPPYLYSAAKEYAEYFSERFKLAQYQTDYYVYFIEKSLQLIRKGGKFGFIISDSWINSEKFSILRNYLLKNHRINCLIVFDYPVFSKATLENSILLLTAHDAPHEFPIVRYMTPRNSRKVNSISPQDAVDTGIIAVREQQGTRALLTKIEKGRERLGSLVRINRGLHAYRTDGYGRSKFRNGPQTKRDKEERSYHAPKKLDESYLPEYRGKDVDRFESKSSGLYISYGEWLAEPREPEFMYSEKIVLRKILGKKLHGTFLPNPAAIDQSLYVVISKAGDSDLLKYILGVLSSKLAAWYLRNKHSIFDTLYPWYTKAQLSDFPVPSISSEIVQLVEALMAIKAGPKPLAGHALTLYNRRLDALEDDLDQAVFRLYGLNPADVEFIASEGTEGS